VASDRVTQDQLLQESRCSI